MIVKFGKYANMDHSPFHVMFMSNFAGFVRKAQPI